MDPPSNAEAFVHRCGRTARIGNKGASILLLCPNEETYVDFLAINQKVTLSKLEPKELGPDADHLTQVRTLLKSDRGHMDRAIRAFVSYVQSYAKHECSILLRIKDLDLGGVATSYGLLRMPKMPELKGVKIRNFVEEKLDLNDVAYQDKVREKERQVKLSTYRETGEWPGAKKKRESVSWSKNREVLNKRREKKLRKAEKRKGSDDIETHNSDEELDESEDFSSDYKLMKKLKKGKISQIEFDEAFDIDNVQEDC